MNIQQVWQDFLSIVSEEAGSRVVETWLKAVQFKEWDSINRVAYLEAPNAFVKEWIKTKYSTLIETHLKRLLHVNQLSIFLLDQTSTKAPVAHPTTVMPALVQAPAPAVAPRPVARPATLIKPQRPADNSSNYTFTNFIVGSHNQLAYAAAKAVCQQPGTTYNPLFIYGSSGLGKTHLLHAIGNEIKHSRKKCSVLYQPADRFVSDFIQAIRFDRVQQFKERFRDIDVLLIDDIQLIAGKDQTQEAFFHIFNALYEGNKQLVFTSDTYPRDMAGISLRLRTRLEWGLVTDIGVPTLETRIAILEKKAEAAKTQVEQELLAFIAQHAPHNVRELEGVFIRVMAFASLTGQPITKELAEKVLGRPPASTEPQRVRSITLDMVASAVEKECGYTLNQLRSPSRHKGMSLARQFAMYLMKKETGQPLTAIAQFLRRSDHTTIMHGVQKIESLLTQDPKSKALLERIEATLKGAQLQ